MRPIEGDNREKNGGKLGCEEELRQQEEIDRSIREKNFRIDVEYIDTFSEDTARIIMIDNAFVINLPSRLAERVFDEDGNYNYKIIQKIRKLMAHELGHLMLHTDELLKIRGTQGSLELREEEKESEADYFAEELIELRRRRNEKVYKDGGAHILLGPENQ